MYTQFPCGFQVHYEVKKEREDLFGIYLCRWGEMRLITHKHSLKQAQKMAKLLSEAYQMGREDEKAE